MYCPKCGKADQKPESYCRQCGGFLAEYDKYSPEKIIKTNLTFSLMTAIVSFSLAITLYAALGFRSETSPVVYMVAALLIAMSAWQFTTFALNLKLKKNFARRNESANVEPPPQNQMLSAETKELLNEANLSDLVPPSVIEATTKNLPEKIHRTSS